MTDDNDVGARYTTPMASMQDPRTRRTALFILATLLVCFELTTLWASPALAGRRCTKSCRRETVACKQTQCSGLAGDRRRACVRACEARIGCAPGAPARGTLVYLETWCRTDAHGLGRRRQALKVRRGDCDAVTVFETATPAPVPDPNQTCRRLGWQRQGNRAMGSGGVQRFGIAPNGSVIFEVTYDTANWPLGAPPTGEDGIFSVRADGTRRRRLGSASRHPAFRLEDERSFTSPITNDAPFSFSPDGRKIAFTDKGPGPDGEDAAQVVTLNIMTRERAVLTKLPVVDRPPDRPGICADTCYPRFVDSDTVQFSSWANPLDMNPNGYFLSFSVRTDGTGLRAIPAPIAGPGAVVLPTFQVAGRRVEVVNVSTDPDSLNCTSYPAQEVYVRDGQNLLQLTRFGMCDTTGFFVSRNRRIVFCASAVNPTKENPLVQSQLFSIDALGGHLRQLTHFPGGRGYCLYATAPVGGRCHIPAAVEDEETGGIVFESSCDPFGTNPNGDLLFAMRSDGSGLRQLTHTRGFIEGAGQLDGAVEVELSGPFAYAARGR